MALSETLNARIRVLRVITRLNVGGPAIHAALLTTRLDPTAFDTLLVTGREGPAEGRMADLGRLAPGLRPRVIGSLTRRIGPVDDARAFADLVRIARAYRPHIVHTHLSKAGFLGRIAGRLAGAPVIVHTFHGSVFRGHFSRPMAAVYLRLECALARSSTAIVAITEGQRRDLAELGVAPLNKIVVIPLGLDLEPFLNAPDREASRRTLGIPADATVVALVGRLVPVKDVPTFLGAVATLRARMPGTVALVVGDGELRPRLEALAAELGLGGSCRFVGWRGDVERFYAAADVVALSSRSEGSPVGLIEALASARPVVATAVGGVPDVVRDGEHGLLVPPGDAAALARAIEELLRDGARRAAYGAAGRAMARARFGADRLVADVERLYRKLLLESSR